MPFFSKYKNVLLIFSSILLYIFFAYFLERTEFYILISLWFALFGCFYLLMQNKQISFSTLVGIAILFRLIFLFATPNLSQDFYRFIWDGRMLFEGLNPYVTLPENIVQQNNFPIADAKELYAGMGELNGSHYTNYPPLNQLCFFIAALFASKSIFGSVIVFRLIIILADLGILYIGKKLLEKLNLPIKNIFWYILNPFIIIEMTGNLHFEPVMLFFFIFGMYKLYQQKWALAAILIGCSISVKLIPLLFLPLFFQWFACKNNSEKDIIISVKAKSRIRNLLKLSSFYILTILTVVILFLPFLSSTFIENYSKSVGLWFGKFEFNASFYYLFREIGYLFRGYNEIAIIGKITPILTILVLIILTFFRKNITLKQVFTAMLFGLCFYYFTSTTVHPWYLATPIILSVFTKYKFPIVWSFVIILSYQAYANNPWQENLWFVALEYLVVYTYIFYEIRRFHRKKMIN
ncbi:mannosyltransferase [Polaribacter vadi]|uniref:mannosyltransferase n=1 Tax=Polaribacter vadi TaxID=1774273 RepID=UPI0030EE0807|tara:strand:+ start:808 stop:2199 length:1392 start_codon:yes stop_codon:yes gene_type:complete